MCHLHPFVTGWQNAFNIFVLQPIIDVLRKARYLLQLRIEKFASECIMVTSLSHRLVVAHRVKIFQSLRLIC